MYQIKLFIPETNTTHRITALTFDTAVCDFLKVLVLHYNNFSPELYEGIFKLSKWATHGEGESTYNHYDMSCPEDNFTLTITEIKG